MYIKKNLISRKLTEAKSLLHQLGENKQITTPLLIRESTHFSPSIEGDQLW